MERLLMSAALVLLLFVPLAATSGEDVQKKPHNTCVDAPTTHAPTIDDKQAETYIDLINATFTLHPNTEADRLDAATILGLWLTECLEKRGPSPITSPATCSACKSSCYSGKWDYACIAACVYNKQCP
jgi:hypothetical protein